MSVARLSQPARAASRCLQRLLAGAATALLLMGCANLQSLSSSEPPAAMPVAGAPAAPQIAVSPSNVGTWFDLGQHQVVWLSGDAPVPTGQPAVPTRVVGLRDADGRWLAIVVAQYAAGGQAACPRPSSLQVKGGGTGKASSCLRLRRDADFDHWLEQQHPAIHQWIADHGWDMRPRAWMAYRDVQAAGVIETHALVDPTLLEPITRNNSDFLAGGQPGLHWARQFANATRAAGGADVLRVPAFPFGSISHETVADASGPIIPTATQVTPKVSTAAAPSVPEPRPAARPPRPDRQ